MTRQQLMQQRDNLKKRLDEVQEQLNKFDTEVYGGKMAKAIKLLGECLDYLNYPTVPLKCPECENMVSDQAKTCIHCGTPINTKEESLLIAKLSKFNYKYPFFVKPFDIVGLFDTGFSTIG